MANPISYKVILRPPLFVFLVGVVFTGLFFDSFYAPKTVVAAVYLGVLLIFGPGIGALRNSPLKYPAGALITWAFLSLALQSRLEFASGNILGLGAALLILMIISGSGGGFQDRKGIITAAAAGVFAVSLYSIIQYYFPASVLEKFRGTARVPFSTLGNRTYVADFLILFIPFLFSGIKKMKTFYLISGALGVWTLLLARSWRSLPAAAAAISVMFILKRGKISRSYALIAAAGALGASVFVFVNRENISERHLRPRLLMWEAGLEMFRDAPVTGQGTGTFARLYPYYQSRVLRNEPLGLPSRAATPERANNEYMHMLAERGFPGLLIFIWLILCWVKNADFSDRNFIAPVAAGSAGLLVSAFFGFPLHRPETLFPLAVFMGASVRASVPEGAEKRSVKFLSYILGVSAFAIAFLITVSQVMHERAAREFKAGNYGSAAHLSSEGASWALLPGKIYFLRGRALYRKGSYAESVEAFGKALETYSSVGLYYSRALAYFSLGQVEKGLEDMEFVISVTPGHRRARRLLAEVYGRLGMDRHAEHHKSFLPEE